MGKNNTEPSKNEDRESKNPTGLEVDGLLGPVKKVMLSTYIARQISGALVQGKLDLQYSLQLSNHITTYNELGDKLSAILFGIDGRHDKKYDAEGREIESISYDRNGQLSQTQQHFYDSKGNFLKALVQDGDGKLNLRSEYTYNEAGLMLETATYTGAEEQLSNKTIFKYNEDNKMISSFQYDGKGDTVHEFSFSYDAKGNQIERVCKYYETRMADYSDRQVLSYNDKGDCIQVETYKLDGTLKSNNHYTHEYDADGKRIVPKNGNDRISTAEIEELVTDDRGNWVKKTLFYNGTPSHIQWREFVYYDDKTEKELIHPYFNEPIMENAFDKGPIEDLTNEEAQWLVDTPGISPENFPYTRFYVLKFKESPSLMAYTGPFIEVVSLREELKKNMDVHEVHSYSSVWGNQGERLNRFTLIFPEHEGYLLQCNSISAFDEAEFDIPRNMHLDDGNAYIGQLLLLMPSEASDKRDEYFEIELEDFINKSTLKKRPDKPTIHMIETNGDDYEIKEHPVDDNFEIKDLDINYGYGFNKFHQELIYRFNSSTKGLVLFHGQPGTGKTYYIRHLLREMATNKKRVIYMPPNMVDRLVEPSFMTFLTGEIKNWSADGDFCVLLIEDAEPLLAKRQEGIRIQGITNLLNMSDGILNDMLNLQIICTFNVDLKKLDSALLRPGRLIARKEFLPLSTLDANLLAQRLGIKHQFKAPATLAEIYALGKHSNTLVHEVDPEEGASTFLDDF